MMLAFDAQNSGSRSLRSSFPPSEQMVCVVSRAPVKGSIQACADRWTGLKAGSQGRCVQSGVVPVASDDAALSWLTSLQVHSSAKLSTPGNFLTKFAKDSCSKNLIF